MTGTVTDARLKRLRDLLQAEDLEAIIITHPVNRRYMTGFTGTAGYAVVTGTMAWFFTDFRYVTQAKQQIPSFEIVEHGTSALTSIGETLRGAGIARLGFEQQHVTYGSYQQYARDLNGITLVPTDAWVDRLRRIKDEDELKVLREAVAVSDAAFEYILSMLKPGLSEREVAFELEMFMRRQGAASASFETIVASGERSALPHGVASDRIIGNNEFVKMDFGAYYHGYCSDLTRTVAIGRPPEKHVELYRIVLEAQLAVLNVLRPGMTGREGDALARDYIEKNGYGSNFGHGTGHAVGMEIHESPRLSKTEEAVLEPGMVVTVEPGIYLPGFGGVRIEDMVVITDSGCDILTGAKKELIYL